MRWFRWHRRAWAGVALLALVLQLGLSFGHVHAIPGPAAVASAPAAAIGPVQPADRGDHDDDYCAICAVLALLTGAQTAAPPALPAPAAIVAAELTAPTQTLRAASPRPAFQSRAPPLS